MRRIAGLFFLCTFPLYGQINSGELRLRVTDPSGLAVKTTVLIPNQEVENSKALWVLTPLYIYIYRQAARDRRTLEPTSVTFMTFAFGSVALIAVGCVLPTTISLTPFGGADLLIFVGLAILCTAIPSFAFASERLPSVVTATISLLIPLFAGAFDSSYSERGFRRLPFPVACSY